MSVGIVRRVGLGATFSILLCLACVSSLKAQTPLTLSAADGLTVYGNYYGGPGKSRPVILLFHQAGSNSAEYAPIAPRLNKDGFDCLAIDQRAGGSMWDTTNQTADAAGAYPTGYLDAMKDLEAALKWARTTRPASKVIVWGSSYSAALVFLLAKNHPADVSAILSFSPGEYLTTSSMVADAAAKVTVPAYITCAPNATEERNARQIFTALGSTDKTFYIPTVAGVHGSSTLRVDRDPTGAASNWTAVEKFLGRLKPLLAPVPPAHHAKAAFPPFHVAKPGT